MHTSVPHQVKTKETLLFRILFWFSLTWKTLQSLDDGAPSMLHIFLDVKK